MGLSNKLATKLRTKAQSNPVALTGTDEEVALDVAAILRGTAASIVSPKLSSSAYRGSDVLGLATTRGSGDSIVWVEQIGPQTWTLGLGVGMANNQRALDWQLSFTLGNGLAGLEVEVTTPAVLTKDGTQVHKGEYKEARDLVLTGLSRGLVPALSAEESVSECGLAMQPVAAHKVLDTAYTDSSLITTELPLKQMLKRLEMLPYKTLSNERDTLRVEVGFPPNAQQVQIALTDAGDRRQARVSYSIEPTGVPHLDFMTVNMAYRVSSRVNELLRSVDPTVTETLEAA